jgi:hypothetical protein
MIRNAMTRLHAEIARSIGFFRAQQGGKQPDRVYLSGGSATLPYMREFFQEKFQIPVEFFNPLRNVTVGPNLNLDEISKSAHRMGELVGLALRGTSDCPMELNLRPARVVRRHQLAEKRPYLIIAGVCALLAMGAWWVYLQQGAKALEGATQELQAQNKIPQLQRYERLIKEARNEITAEQDTAAPFLKAVDERTYWTQVIDDINSRLPKEYVWVTNFDVKLPESRPGQQQSQPQQPKGPPGQGGAGGKGGAGRQGSGPQVILKGLYLANDRNAQVVDDFVTKLGESSLYTVDKAHIERSVPNEKDWAYDFKIPLTLNNPIEGLASTAR